MTKKEREELRQDLDLLTKEELIQILLDKEENESKWSRQDNRLHDQNQQDAWTELQPAGVGVSSRRQAPGRERLSLFRMLRVEGQLYQISCH